MARSQGRVGDKLETNWRQTGDKLENSQPYFQISTEVSIKKSEVIYILPQLSRHVFGKSGSM